MQRGCIEATGLACPTPVVHDPEADHPGGDGRIPPRPERETGGGRHGDRPRSASAPHTGAEDRVPASADRRGSRPASVVPADRGGDERPRGHRQHHPAASVEAGHRPRRQPLAATPRVAGRGVRGGSVVLHQPFQRGAAPRRAGGHRRRRTQSAGPAARPLRRLLRRRRRLLLRRPGRRPHQRGDQVPGRDRVRGGPEHRHALGRSLAGGAGRDQPADRRGTARGRPG